MKKVFVFCIGGTGIRVMKSAIMLMAGGMKTNGYAIVPVIIDPHLDLEEKKNLHTLIERYQTVYNRCTQDGKSTLNALDGFFGTKLATIDELNNQQENTNQDAGSDQNFGIYIGESAMDANHINHFFINTLFSTKNLKNSLNVGFKGNPNVGTVVLGNMIEGAAWYNGFKTHCEKDDRIFIISSIFGGTGASGFPLLEKKIKEIQNQPTLKEALMGAVTVLPYYGLKDPAATGSDIDSANFYTKTKAALAYYNGTIRSDYLYYVGEKNLRAVYENNEQKQQDTANFVELVAASALFHFLQQEKPNEQQFLMRAIDDNADSLSLKSLGMGYRDIIKSVADYKLLSMLIHKLPSERWFPLRKHRKMDNKFYRDASFQSLVAFSDIYEKWYEELAGNNRAFAPLNCNNPNQMSGWIKDLELDAEDYTYYFLEMVKESNNDHSKEHNNTFRHFLQFAHRAIDNYTSKLNK